MSRFPKEVSQNQPVGTITDPSGRGLTSWVGVPQVLLTSVRSLQSRHSLFVLPLSLFAFSSSHRRFYRKFGPAAVTSSARAPLTTLRRCWRADQNQVRPSASGGRRSLETQLSVTGSPAPPVLLGCVRVKQTQRSVNYVSSGGEPGYLLPGTC